MLFYNLPTGRCPNGTVISMQVKSPHTDKQIHIMGKCQKSNIPQKMMCMTQMWMDPKSTKHIENPDLWVGPPYLQIIYPVSWLNVYPLDLIKPHLVKLECPQVTGAVLWSPSDGFQKPIMPPKTTRFSQETRSTIFMLLRHSRLREEEK